MGAVLTHARADRLTPFVRLVCCLLCSSPSFSRPTSPSPFLPFRTYVYVWRFCATRKVRPVRDDLSSARLRGDQHAAARHEDLLAGAATDFCQVGGPSRQFRP